MTQDETRPILQGILFEVKEKKLNLVALDGYRMAIKTEYLDNDFDIEVVIPGKTLNEVSKILEDVESIVNITFTNNHILFNLGETKIISRLLEGKYVNYLSLLPQEHKLLINVNRQELQNGIERASLMAKEGNSNLVKLEMNEESIIITSNSQLGKVREEVTANMQGEQIQIAFNSRYIIDVLKNMEDDNVQIEMTSSVSPCVIKGKEAESYKYLVLPKEGNSNLVKLEMNEESIVITSNSQLGKVREEVTANMQGEQIQIAFNSRYIIDVLKNMEDDNVQIEMTSSVSPCVIKGKESESYKYLVLPVRLIR